MKKNFISGIITGLVLLSMNGFASDNSKQSLMDSFSLNNIEIMASGGAEFSTIGGANVGSGDFRLGALLNNHFTTALYYQRSVNDFSPVNELAPGLYTEYQSVGGMLGFTIFPNRLLHATFPIKVGYGHLEMDSSYDWDGWMQNEQHLLIIQPGAFAVLNVTPIVSLYMGATYRFTNNFQYRTITEANMMGFTGQIGLKFQMPVGLIRNL